MKTVFHIYYYDEVLKDFKFLTSMRNKHKMNELIAVLDHDKIEIKKVSQN
jgi:hypothetical protein